MTTTSGTVQFLGSDSWIGDDATQPDDEFHQRASTFIAAVKWDALLTISSRLRHGISCKISDKFSIGHFNMVRRIIFDDQVSWIARLRLPPISAVPADREAASVARILEVEVAGMNFLRAKTDIPVPLVHSYNTEPFNDVGAPYILMDYIHGTVASEMRLAKGCALGLYGTPEQDRNFRREMATIQTALTSFTFDRIGSLYQDPITAEFFIGPDIETNKGPWSYSSDYFADVAKHSLQVCINNATSEVLTSASCSLPVIFNHLIQLFESDHISGDSLAAPFCLTNRDFGPHNLLVDEDFHIIGVIDFDGIMAAPYEVAAQFPVLAGLDPEPPGHVETRPMALERIVRMEPLIREYNGMVREIEERAGSGRRKIWDIMLSDHARAVQGLNQYKSHQKQVNDNWMRAYTRLLVGHFSSTASNSFANQEQKVGGVTLREL